MRESFWPPFEGELEAQRLSRVGYWPRRIRLLPMRFVIATFTGALSLVSLPVSAGNTLQAQVERARSHFTERDPSLTRFFEEAYAYALFPRIKKGAIGLGGAYGKGLVYRDGRKVARTSVSQATVGFQLGGQILSEVIFFQDRQAFRDFTSGDWELSAQVSAIAAAEGVAANARYRHGVAIFTLAQSGVMVEASVGGQKFSYSPL